VALRAVQRGAETGGYADGVIGQIAQTLDVSGWYPLPFLEICEVIQHLEEFSTSHREVPSELSMTKSTESFCDEIGCGTRGIPELIAKFEVVSKRGCGTNRHDPISQLRRKLPGTEFFEG
jgi:hypothetical protein